MIIFLPRRNVVVTLGCEAGHKESALRPIAAAILLIASLAALDAAVAARANDSDPVVQAAADEQADATRIRAAITIAAPPPWCGKC